MANPLFNAFGGKQIDAGVSSFLAEVRNFQKSFQGDPKDAVQKMLNSGEISQQQFNELAAIANQLMPLLTGNK